MRGPRALVRRGAGVLAALALLSCGDGAEGPAGMAGLMGGGGLRGATGPRGPQGMQGAQGAPGAQGPRGMQGLVNFRSAQIADPLSLPGTFPWNDQAPQINQGSQLLSVSITPQSDASVLVFDGVVHWTEGNVNSSDYFTAALFQEGVSAALASASDAASNSNGRCTADGTYAQICSLGFHFIVPSPGNAATTYQLRVGLNAGTVRINAGFNGRQLGGRLASTLSVMEIAK